MVKDFTIITCNVRGLGDSNKRRAVFHYLHQKKVEIIFLQELHSLHQSEVTWSNEWGNKI